MTENNIFFTILTASLNADATMRSTLESVRNQTFQGFEHIVIDGKSSDNTVIILKDYQGTYNLHWCSERDKGISDALNRGLKLATGHYILVIQADDALLNPFTLERVFFSVKKKRYDIHSFPVIMTHPVYGEIMRKPIRRLWWNRFKFIFPHQGCFVHRRVFEKVGGFREDFAIAMDYDFFYRAILARCTVKFHRTPPVAKMGGKGIGTRLDCLNLRLAEERMVQDMNETNTLWRAFQFFFRKLYVPYKTKLLSR
jgi:glycosyltransferase involved in cell wall biosynthesis